MDIDNQARDSVTREREHKEHQEALMDKRTQEEVRTVPQESETVTESARESATSQRQSQEAQQANMQYRAQEHDK
jgi:hypothetical protein